MNNNKILNTDDYMNQRIILDTDLKNESDTIVKDTLNSFYRDNLFFCVLKSLSEGHGFGDNVTSIIYWHDFDEDDKQDYDESFEKIGIELAYLDDEVIVPYDDLYYYLEIAFKRYIQDIPEQKKELEKYITEIKIIFNECKNSK